jgi:benzylsuccinate CoA-transferase BbsE subunit
VNSNKTHPSLLTAALDGLRVLDLSNRFGHYAGKLLADMGAEVILIEKPLVGNAIRKKPPFIDDRVNSEFGIPHFYFNTNKRSITLDIRSRQGKAIFLNLVKTADIVLEDDAPQYWHQWGLDFESLQALNPKLIMTSITPFGQTGPYANYAADDLTLLALGGLLNIMGFEDIEPTQAAGEQAYAMGCMFGAVGTMLAVLEAQHSQLGQHVDVSIQESVTMALENSAQSYDLEKKIRVRSGNSQRYAGSGIFKCLDGFVYVFAGGMAASRFWNNLVEWFELEGVAGAHELASPKWQDLQYMHSEEGKQLFELIFTSFANDKTMAYLYETAQSRRIPLCPVNDSQSILSNQQLMARSFFQTVLHEHSGQMITMPGAPYLLSQTPWSLRNPAPSLGQDNSLIFKELGLSEQEILSLSASGVI